MASVGLSASPCTGVGAWGIAQHLSACEVRQVLAHTVSLQDMTGALLTTMDIKWVYVVTARVSSLSC